MVEKRFVLLFEIIPSASYSLKENMNKKHEPQSVISLVR